jgi:site-specific DNA recombinase
MRVALYVRVSTDRQQQAQTIEQQVAQLRAWVATHAGWTVREEHIFRDDGHSGAKLDRPGLDALRDHAARAAFDVVLVTAPDRLARNFVRQMVVLEELERRGVRVVFCDRPLTDDPHEQLVTQIRGAVAEYERVLIADRMRRGRLAKLRSGQLLPWTRAPFGYRLHPERPRDPAALQIDPVAAVVVQELFAAYAAGGVTLHALAAQLTERRVPTPTGKPVWRPSSIRQLLTNPAYKGQAASGRLRTTPARRRKSSLEPIGRGVSTRAHPSQEWITVPVPALVSAEQFDLIARRLATNQRSARRSTTHPYLLRGLVSCGICRLSCSGITRTATDTRYRYYRCLGKQAKVASGRLQPCTARFIPATQLDELVWADLCAVLQHPELVTQAVERAHSGAWVPQELRRRQATLRRVLASVARQRQRLLEAYLAEVIDLACFQRQDRTLGQQEADLLAREREVAAQGERLVGLSATAQSMTQILEQLRVGLDQAGFQQRRQLVELLIDRVVVTDGHVEIRYVIPTTKRSTHTRFCHLRTDYFKLPPLVVERRQFRSGRLGRVQDRGQQPVGRGRHLPTRVAKGVLDHPHGDRLALGAPVVGGTDAAQVGPVCKLPVHRQHRVGPGAPHQRRAGGGRRPPQLCPGEQAVGQQQHPRTEHAQQRPRQGRLAAAVGADGRRTDRVGAALGHPDHADLREGGLLAPMGLRPAKRPLVGLGIRHVQGRPVDRQHPPAPIPRPLRLLAGKRPGDLGEQPLQHLRPKPLPGPGDRLGRGDLPRSAPVTRPPQPAHQQPGDLLVGLPAEQRHRQHQVDHHPGGQQPMPPLPPARLGDHPIHQLRRERRSQHPDRDPIRQPLLHRRLDLTRSWHPPSSRGGRTLPGRPV